MAEIQNCDIRIVIVDDEEIVLSLIRDALSADGYHIQTASDGDEALKIAGSQTIDILISDIRMPRMDGIELVRRMRKIQPDVAVIFATGYASLSSAKDAIRQGACEYILKPFELRDIRQAVAKAVKVVKKNATARNVDNQLDQLSDLNRMLFTGGDTRTLITVSLRFSLMHCQSSCGAAIYWNHHRTKFTMLTINGDDVDDHPLPADLLAICLDNIDWQQLEDPVLINSIEDHPFYKAYADHQLEQLAVPSSDIAQYPFVVVPVNRSNSVYGIFVIKPGEGELTAGESALKFLNITANQLAMSLENLQLLNEAQDAYVRLKELQDETIQLEKMAARGEMSAEIGHELNNFLGVVAGNLSLLDAQLKRQNYTEMERYVKAMADNIDKIKNFTGSLMDLQPISTQKEIIYFDKLIAEVIDYLRPQRRYQGVDIRLLSLSDELPFQADMVHIQQLLYNLLNNAADATAEQKIRQITVSARKNEDEESFRVTVCDTGIGIPADLLEKAFKEKFTTKETGHGFGLLVSKRIIDSHGGMLSIESTPGVGTSISIDFPPKTRIAAGANTGLVVTADVTVSRDDRDSA